MCVGMTGKKENTKARIVEALGTVLARDGFGGVNVEAIAREAGANKALIYRYFGNLDALIETYATGPGFWPTKEEIVGMDIASFRQLPLDEQISLCICHFIEALKARPQTVEILAMEFVQSSPISDKLNIAREQSLADLLALAGIEPVDRELSVELSILAAGMTYVLLRRRTTRIYNEIELQTEDGWEELVSALKSLVQKSYGKAGPRA